jgi:4-diphosphocytidyl-2-C-methyl-D-erythritol kinase
VSEWEAPAKLNLDLRVASPDAGGMHPLRSIAQTIELCDLLRVEENEADALRIDGADLADDGDNLVWKAVEALQWQGRPRLDIELRKRIPVAAGLGGGSADAAAILRAVGSDMMHLADDRVREVAARVGADVAYMLTGGTAVMEGYGERVTPLDALEGFSVGVAVPPFELATAEVYQRWDFMGGPVGEELGGRDLPPPLRGLGELRNDLTPAAISMRPDLADWMSDLGRRWERPVLMSGSGPACFGFFLDIDEAEAATATVGEARAAVAAELRKAGVGRLI